MQEERVATPFRKKESLFAALAIICSFITYFILPETIPEAGKRVAAIFVFAVFFWAFEIIPLYATSLLVVILLSFLLTKPSGILELGETGYQLFLVPFSSPVIMLFLGGFVLAAAGRKHHVDAFLMKKILSKLGQRTSVILLGFLFMSAFFSMWMSNTAATALMLMLVKPMLARVDADDPFRKGLVLATAFGANIGGMGTPIGTPPNAIALGILTEQGMHIDFISWMAFAVPLAFILLIITAACLYFFFRPKLKKIPYFIYEDPKFTGKGVSVLIIGLFMITMWLTKPLHGIPEALIALLGVGLFASFQLISNEDFRQINWDILVLIWGGLALGEGIQVSGMLDRFLQIPLVEQHDFWLIAAFCLLALILSTFISNTATANLLVPIAITVSSIDQSPLAITVALSCSLALAFPISTPPNAMAYGTGEFRTKEMFMSGATISVLGLILILIGFEYLLPLFIRTP
ncbi:MAG: DASS family sodium-coupled anion symporter [Chlamydiales bacterium]|nr:DASS family sodium-coupled anion symporter [Chlamydiales bacterium]